MSVFEARRPDASCPVLVSPQLSVATTVTLCQTQQYFASSAVALRGKGREPPVLWKTAHSNVWKCAEGNSGSSGFKAATGRNSNSGFGTVVNRNSAGLLALLEPLLRVPSPLRKGAPTRGGRFLAPRETVGRGTQAGGKDSNGARDSGTRVLEGRRGDKGAKSLSKCHCTPQAHQRADEQPRSSWNDGRTAL